MVISKIANWLVKNHPDAVLTALKPDSKNWKAGCEFMVEMDGHKYYRFRDSGDVPLVRYKEIQAVLIQLDNRLTSDELLNILSIARESVVAAIEGQSRKERGKGLQQCLWAIQEAESRHKELGLHTDLIVELAALNLIRGDENPFEINEGIQAEKLRLFKREFTSHDFFLSAGMNEFLPNAGQLAAVWQQLWQTSDQHQQKKKEIFQSILGEIRSSIG
jgi:hypothetical protein